jgi:hypothetical protein
MPIIAVYSIKKAIQDSRLSACDQMLVFDATTGETLQGLKLPGEIQQERNVTAIPADWNNPQASRIRRRNLFNLEKSGVVGEILDSIAESGKQYHFFWESFWIQWSGEHRPQPTVDGCVPLACRVAGPPATWRPPQAVLPDGCDSYGDNLATYVDLKARPDVRKTDLVVRPSDH